MRHRGERMPKWCPGCPTKRCSNPSTGILRIALSARLVLWVSLACTLAAAAAGRCIIEATMLRQTGRLQSAHSCKLRLCARTIFLLRLWLRLYHIVTVTVVPYCYGYMLDQWCVKKALSRPRRKAPNSAHSCSALLLACTIVVLFTNFVDLGPKKQVQKCAQISTHEKHL